MIFLYSYRYYPIFSLNKQMFLKNNIQKLKLNLNYLLKKKDINTMIVGYLKLFNYMKHFWYVMGLCWLVQQVVVRLHACKS